ncbi:sn-glycerol-3-phosphate import ATP-binding protein UgpC [Agrobacterium vitis]|uniref:sn-glycerol-3-phosphate import ATP-binding protein UgpC n=1 Tax=Agrobacterium vitis TaxID=373 RepID=A0A368NZA9_AGRVI|nr:sn-glycerol-3-phosphate import ATP-binding protein UgpC [Agrobacterium vitis]KAA3518478.1 sn-glycerol-3-phosphate import ATP-binding protein UgpC [Agrobacterium vitis]KAA3530074.1 sn-glycerol-3-phosphate import ATP-binding protein UgpC [Agrobacterium vitis]MCF1476560.1 sn-glycerol-3-phosphate import ATP-binding protein UgpC [Agrobacterium vitis]MUZ96244.1 sn-glycerol-3-phosphate ABC transporter ATP-binding protein UgpC [Agrobacterium vitis]MVA29353.1 sn-glycerol-3-phosphate ABC transporter 
MADIDIRAVRKSYGKTPTLHGIDLLFGSGEFVVILGPSGCGKSTLLRMIAGLEDITSGEIAIDGRVVNTLEPRERGCAMVFQNYALYPHMSVAGNIGYALKVAGVPKAERDRRITETAKIVGLQDYLDRRPAALSGGQRQRVAMARAIIREPKVFLFDEPLSNLDAKLRVTMRAEIRKLHQRLSATSVFVTHDQVEAMTLADRLVVMNRGHVEQVGRPLDIYHRPATTFVASFIGSPAMNLFDARVEVETSTIRLGGASVEIDPVVAHTLRGRDVIVGIRPEQCRLASHGQGVPALIEFVEELGVGRVVHCELAGHPFAIAVPEEAQVTAGDTIGLLLPQQQLHFFDSESQKRIDFSPMTGAANSPANSQIPSHQPTGVLS